MLILKKAFVFLMPVLFAVYSVLAFYSYNVHAVKFTDITRIVVAVVVFSGVVTGLFFFIFRDRSKASLIATCWMIIFFSYGQVYNVFHKSLGVYIGRNAILVPVALVLMLLSVIWIWRLVQDPSTLIIFFSWMIAVHPDLLFARTILSFDHYQ
jgi:hypothetical protein